MLDEGPSKLYDALSKVLGLDDLVDAQTTLQQARTTRDKAQKDADQERKTILAKLETLTDERAARIKELLGKKDWGLSEVEAILAGEKPSRDRDSAEEVLKRLSVLPSPDEEAIETAVKALREAAERQTQAAQTVAGKSDDLASLLDHALRFHQAHGDGDCPVCGKKDALDNAWHQDKAKEAETLRQAAREASEARQATKAGDQQRQEAPQPRPRAPEEARIREHRRAGQQGPEPRTESPPADGGGHPAGRQKPSPRHSRRGQPAGSAAS